MSEMRREILVILCLCLTAAVPLLPILQNEFTNWDDQVNVTKNPYLPEGFSRGLVPLISNSYECLYVPVTYAAYWLQFHLCGGSAFSFHLFNLFCHVVSVGVVYLILRRLLPGWFLPSLVALWWGVHPLIVEPVAWVTGLKDVLSVLLTLVSLRTYMAWRDAESQGRGTAWLWVMSLGAFVLACLSKPGVVVFPVVLAAYDLWVARRNCFALWPTVPHFAVSALIITVTMSLQKWSEDSAAIPALLQRLQVAGSSYLFYLQKIICPIGLSPIYGRTISEATTSPRGWIGIGVVCGMAAIAWRGNLRWRFGVILFLAGLAPVCGLVSFGYQQYSTVADRYAYLSLVGVALMLGDLISRFGLGSTSRLNKRGFAIVGVAVLWLCLLGSLTFGQTKVWRDSLSVWNRVLEVNPTVATAYYNRGNAWLNKGNYGEAISDYSDAIRLKPDLVDAYCDRGYALARVGDYDGAIRDYTSAIALKPTFADAYYNRGSVREQKSDYDGAIDDFTLAVSFRWDYAKAYNARGAVLGRKGDYLGAIRDCTRAIEIQPSWADSYCNRAVSYYGMRIYDKAWDDVNRCLERGGGVNPALIDFLQRESAQPDEQAGGN